MARTNDPNSATSQFFIMHGPYPSLNNQYTVWGQVISGIEVVDKIVNLPKIQGDNPGKAAEIMKATIEEGKGHKHDSDEHAHKAAHKEHKS